VESEVVLFARLVLAPTVSVYCNKIDCYPLIERIKMNLLSKFLLLILVLHCFQLKARNNIKDDTIARQLFIKAEQKAIEFRKGTYELRFVDPIEMNEVFYKIVIKESPELYTDTQKYKNGLIKILKDKSIIRDDETNRDVFRILSNLCIEDYVDVIDSVYSFHMQKQVEFEDLYDAVFQDFNLSNQVGKKFDNERLQVQLTQILQDIKTRKLLVVSPPYGFQEGIEDLLSGKLWKDELKEFEKIQPPLLNQKNCD
jgi:hypothetical protein